MLAGIWLLIIWGLFMIALGIAFFVWAVLKGQFEDVEETKWIVFREDEPEPWPRRRPPARGRIDRGGA